MPGRALSGRATYPCYKKSLQWRTPTPADPDRASIDAVLQDVLGVPDLTSVRLALRREPIVGDMSWWRTPTGFVPSSAKSRPKC